jgi:hypothetical protein
MYSDVLHMLIIWHNLVQADISNMESMKGRLESAEWLNAAVQLVWRRYPLLVAEWLRKDIVDEILEVLVLALL